MLFAVNDGIRIRYEVVGHGMPLVMAHPGTVALEMWQELGYVEALCADYRLILFDARGHGQSDKPHTPEQYAPELMVSDVLAVMNEVGIDQAHYMGVSMGAAIGFELARRHLDRFYGLALIGYGKYGALTEAQQQFAMGGLQLFGLGAAMGGEAVLVAIEQAGGPQSPGFQAAYRANDWQALLAFQQAFVTWPGFENVLPGVTVPSLVMASKADLFYPSALQCAEAMPPATFVGLPGGGHSQDHYPPQIVVPYVKAFLSHVKVH